MLVVYVGLIGVAGVEFAKTPTGFIPEQDQGYLINVVQLPPGATLDRTEKVVRRGIDIILGTKGVEHVAPFAGLDATTFTVASNAGNDLLRLAVALQSRASGRDREHGAWPTCASACRSSRMPMS